MSDMAGVVGVVNAGSSSLKFSLFDGDHCFLDGQVDGIGVRPGFRAKDASGAAVAGPDLSWPAPKSPAEALMALLPWLRERLEGRPLAGLGHRVVHGGATHERPERVTPALLEELGRLSPLAPLHQPHNLAPIRTALEKAPGLPQVACFDTAFHHTMPAVVQAYAIPSALARKGIRRYGFHGLSYEYIASALPKAAPGIAEGRVVVAHLGNGASLCGMRAGRSIATTMGFSALDGLPMGTRCGELDPAVVLHLLNQEGMTAAEVEDLLYRRSGMLGLSGISSDFRELLASREPARALRHRGLRPSRRARHRLARGGARRAGWPGLHRRRRRERGTGARHDLRGLCLAGRRARSRRPTHRMPAASPRQAAASRPMSCRPTRT